jgi:hypothetical protein
LPGLQSSATEHAGFIAAARIGVRLIVGWAKRSVPTIHPFRVGNEDVAHPTVPHEGDGAPKDAVGIRIDP